MNIDWITIGAQVLNFLILVWLMKHFLYKPILNAIDARESRIDAELKDANLKKVEAQRERNEFLQKNEEFNRQRADLMNQMTDEVKAERQRLLEEAHKAADGLSSKRQEKLRNEAHSLMNTMNDWTRQEVFAITRKTLEDLASTSLEERLGEVFLRRLREMDDKTKDSFAQALKTADEPALLRSAFELPTEQRVAIQKALKEICAAEIHVQFVTAPDLISGIELTTNGKKIAWSIADYLASMEKGVEELFKEKDNLVANTESKA